MNEIMQYKLHEALKKYPDGHKIDVIRAYNALYQRHQQLIDIQHSPEAADLARLLLEQEIPHCQKVIPYGVVRSMQKIYALDQVIHDCQTVLRVQEPLSQ